MEELERMQPAEPAETEETGAEDTAFALLLRQRDEAVRDAARLRTELEDSRRAQYLAIRGIPAAEAGYVAGLLREQVTEDCSFETAAERYLKARSDRTPPLRVDLTAPVGGGGGTLSPGDAMNRLLREARRR